MNWKNARLNLADLITANKKINEHEKQIGSKDKQAWQADKFHKTSLVITSFLESLTAEYWHKFFQLIIWLYTWSNVTIENLEVKTWWTTRPKHVVSKDQGSKSAKFMMRMTILYINISFFLTIPPFWLAAAVANFGAKTQ